VVGVLAAQTPQVFDGTLLLDRYAEASRVGFVGQDTHEVIARFGGADVAALPGDPDNIKVTYPPDLARVRPLPGPSGSGLP
jgi:2-C-methyl-D-erythritol 4-phosphate cytidylyltransferase